MHQIRTRRVLVALLPGGPHQLVQPATVTDDGISVATDHCTLTQRWSLFRGYRGTRDHLVLLSRDPNILCLEVLPKSGLRAAEDAIRLQALLDRHLNRA
ncbi:YcxB family protein [Streptomyces sp. NPDC000880]